MKGLKFNSQICTTREQSERLIALGLKKETADCCYYYYDGEYLIAFAEDAKYPSDIPAWSLHRLIELKQPNTIDNAIVVLSREQTYDKLIGMIAKSIKEGYFPKGYLVDQDKVEDHCKGILEYLDYIRGNEMMKDDLKKRKL